ncbi:hypothetical protein [Nocardioides campestrisoli]|uniref:hypothetical protein n=1 Tax=Nocardioides campestrisoli TaxID=2736757 RepID=UPI00163DDFF9|nr:hypothetical protein [Nocardioides campestrisoli]
MSAAVANGRARASRGLAPVVDVAALGWLAWAGVAFLALQTVASWWVPVCVLVAVLVIWWHRGRRARAGLGYPVLVLATVLVAGWAVITLAVGPASGGDVVWVLPEWAPSSGTPIGGVVTTGRLIGGISLAGQALAHLALVALVLRCVSGERLARLADVTLGRAARFVHPACFAAEELARAERARPALAAHGLGGVTSSVPEAVASAAERADQWGRGGLPDEPARLTRVRVLVVLAIVLTATTGAVGRTVTGVEASLLAVLAIVGTGAVLARARFVVGRAVDLAPAACAVLTAVLVLSEADPTLCALSLLMLPAVTTAVPEDTRGEQ